MRNNIVLVGFMATGKSTVGRDLAERLGLDVVDTDDLVERNTGKTISDIFAQEGEAAFRDQESLVAEQVSRLSGHVIITGGGIVLRDRNVKALKESGPVVCLQASPEVILKRTKDSDHRPLLNTEDPLKRIRALLEERAPFYAKADYTMDTSTMTVREVVDRIAQMIRERYPEIAP